MWRWALVGLLAVGCDDGGSAGDGADAALAGDAGSTPDVAMEPAGPCVPAQAEWAGAMQAFVTESCGQCHAAEPKFGAPFTLLDYDALLSGEPGARRVDRMVERLRAGTMPPAGQPRPEATAQNAFLDWATCGENTGAPPDGPNPGGFDATREIFEPPAQPPEGAAAVEWRADRGHIGANEADRYRCYSFTGTETDRFVRRIEPIIDDDRVLHHIVLYRFEAGPGGGAEVPCGGNLTDIVYAWAPGGGALQFPEGGLRISDADRFVLEFHYNNSAGHADVADRSGVRVYHDVPEGVEVGMLTLGPTEFVVPAGERVATAGDCDVEAAHTVIAAMPHMHEIGETLTSTITRADGTTEDLITVDGWQFDSQFFYGVPLELAAGDVVTTECVFENDSGSTVRFGPFTDDEMCFNFVYVTPPPAQSYCNRPVAQAGFEYVPGECAPEGAADAPAIRGGLHEGDPPYERGGEALDGRYVLVGFEFWLDSFTTPAGMVDGERSFFEGAGALELAAGRLTVDVQGLNTFYAGGGDQMIARDVDFSFAGPITEVDTEAGTLVVDAECGGETRVPLSYGFDGARPYLSTTVPELPGSELVLVFADAP